MLLDDPEPRAAPEGVDDACVFANGPVCVCAATATAVPLPPAMIKPTTASAAFPLSKRATLSSIVFYGSISSGGARAETLLSRAFPLPPYTLHEEVKMLWASQKRRGLGTKLLHGRRYTSSHSPILINDIDSSISYV